MSSLSQEESRSISENVKWGQRKRFADGKASVAFSRFFGYDQDEHGYWWLNANPKIWSFSDLQVGEVQDYTLFNENGNKRRVFQNFIDAKAGDLVIGYESNPVKQVVALVKVSAANDGQKIYFEKTESLANPIDYQTLKECPELEKMEFFQNPNGSFFKLT